MHDLAAAARLIFHPNINTASVTISGADLRAVSDVARQPGVVDAGGARRRKCGELRSIFRTFVNFFTKPSIMWIPLPVGAMAMSKTRSAVFVRPVGQIPAGQRIAGGAGRVASYTLIGAIILLGGIGYAVDVWQGTAPWGLFDRALCSGSSSGFYELVKTIWHK